MTTLTTDMLNEARRDMADVLEELGAVCTHLREAMDFAENGSCKAAVACVEDAQGAIDTTMAELTKIRDRAGRWAVWAEQVDSSLPSAAVAIPKEGDRVHLDRDYAGIPAGSKGTVIRCHSAREEEVEVAFDGGKIISVLSRWLEIITQPNEKSPSVGATDKDNAEGMDRHQVPCELSLPEPTADARQRVPHVGRQAALRLSQRRSDQCD